MPLLPQAPLPVVDPVCWAVVEGRPDSLKLEYREQLFHFYPAECMKSFAGDPTWYGKLGGS